MNKRGDQDTIAHKLEGNIIVRDPKESGKGPPHIFILALEYWPSEIGVVEKT